MTTIVQASPAENALHAMPEIDVHGLDVRVAAIMGERRCSRIRRKEEGALTGAVRTRRARGRYRTACSRRRGLGRAAGSRS